MATLTAEQAKQGYIEKMGEPLGTQFAELWQQVARLHMKWLEYVELYGTNQKRFDLMSQAAPRFFHKVLHDMMWEDTLLHIARLTDKGKGRLTLHNLSQLVKDPAARKIVKAFIAKVEKDAKFVRDWRNNQGAHLNLLVAIEDPSAPAIMRGSRKQVNDVVDGIVAVLNAVTASYNESESFFRMAPAAGGALSLLYVIDSGLKADEAHKQRLLQGKATPDDYGHRNI